MAKDPSLEKIIKRSKKQVNTFKKAFQSIRSAIRKLSEDGNDREANLAVGKYYCFVKSKWTKGLSFLKKTGHTPFRDVAELETKPSDKLAARDALGDCWLKLTAHLKKKNEKRAAEARAFFWYGQALRLSQPLDRIRLEKKVADLLQIKRVSREGAVFWLEPAKNVPAFLDRVTKTSPKIHQGKLGSGLPTPPRLDRTELVYPPSKQVKSVGPTGTIVVWVKVDSVNKVHTLVERGPGYLQDFGLYVDRNKVRGWVKTVRGKTAVKSDPILVAGVWICATLTWNARSVAIYLNGIKHAEKELNGSPLYNQDTLRLGKSTFKDGYLKGQYALVLVYNRRLSPHEVWGAYFCHRAKIR